MSTVLSQTLLYLKLIFFVFVQYRCVLLYKFSAMNFLRVAPDCHYDYVFLQILLGREIIQSKKPRYRACWSPIHNCLPRDLKLKDA